MARKRQPHARNLSLAGLITGYIGIGISVLWIAGIIVFIVIGVSTAASNGYSDY
jgi:hypothetical protein